MPAIYDDLGNEIADIPLSEKQQTVLDAGEEIVVLYHTPQLLRRVLGQQDGRFTLGMDGERITTTDPVSLKKYADLQRAIKAAREMTCKIPVEFGEWRPDVAPSTPSSRPKSRTCLPA